MCYSCTCLVPPRLAVQLFAGQTIQLVSFCTKNKVVVAVAVVVVVVVVEGKQKCGGGGGAGRRKTIEM